MCEPVIEWRKGWLIWRLRLKRFYDSKTVPYSSYNSWSYKDYGTLCTSVNRCWHPSQSRQTRRRKSPGHACTARWLTAALSRRGSAGQHQWHQTSVESATSLWPGLCVGWSVCWSACHNFHLVTLHGPIGALVSAIRGGYRDRALRLRTHPILEPHIAQPLPSPPTKNSLAPNLH